MPIIEGWEVSPDRIEKYEKILSSDDIGDPIITSKCKLDKENGLLVASNNGFAWRIKMGYGTSYMSMGKSKWVRWHDVSRIDNKKDYVILTYIKVRNKEGRLKIDGKGNPKLKKWVLKCHPNKNEDKGHYVQRRSDFYNIMSDLFNRNKGDVDPPTSDTRI